MNEIQRQTYLSALGIDNYVPRWLLPGAPAPRACVLPIPAEAARQSIAEEIPSAPDMAADGAAQEVLPRKSAALAAEHKQVLDELIMDKRLAQKAPAATADSTAANGREETGNSAAGRTATAPTEAATAAGAAAPTAVVTSAPVPRFALSIWRISDDLLVVDSREARLALPTDQLLGNILFALGYRLPGLPKAEILRWPLLENRAADQGEAQARDMLHGYLDAQLLRRPARFLLLMGREAARYMLPASPLRPFTELLGQSVDLETPAVRAIVTPSLAAMLQEPAQKAVTWRAIQALRIGG